MLSNNLKARFCKDMGLPIKIYDEPIFSSRLQLAGMSESYNAFKNMIETSFNGNEEEFFAYNESLFDDVCKYITNSEAFIAFQKDATINSKFSAKKLELAENIIFLKGNIYSAKNIGKKYLSIDMKKANFSGLVHYGISNNLSFYGNYDYDSFMKQFTNLDYFINSKRLRQVIFGMCNPGKQVAYESLLMMDIVDSLKALSCFTGVISLNSDEVIFELADEPTKEELEIITKVCESSDFPVVMDIFRLRSFGNTQAYAKESVSDKHLIVKCLNPLEAPFVWRFVRSERIKSLDSYFEYEGHLAQLVTPIDVNLI